MRRRRIVAGPTGAGKSTVAGLVARFYDPQTGQVLLDGHDLRTLRLDALRRNTSVVLQDVFLFNGSVRENIRFSKPEASDAEIVARRGLSQRLYERQYDMSA